MAIKRSSRGAYGSHIRANLDPGRLEGDFGHGASSEISYKCGALECGIL